MPSFRRNRFEHRTDFWEIPEPDPRRERIRLFSETLCGPVVLRSVGIIGLSGAIAALVALNPLILDSDREYPPVPQVVLQPTAAADWNDASLGFTGSLPVLAAAPDAKPVRTIDPDVIVASAKVASDGNETDIVAATPDAAASPDSSEIETATPAEAAASSVSRAQSAASAPVAWGPSSKRVAAPPAAADGAAGPVAPPELVALVAAPPDPGGALEAATDRAIAAIPLPKPRPEKVPQIVKAKAGAKATTPKAGALGPPPDCGKLHAYWRYTDRKRGLRQWYCR